MEAIHHISTHIAAHDFLFYLLIVLLFAKIFGELAERFGQPSVLGELCAGVVLSGSVLALVPASEGVVGYEVFQLFAEIGVVLLLFEIGLETKLGELVKVGPTAILVAIVGVVAPFVLGYACVIYFQKFSLISLEAGEVELVAMVVGATLTATSVGITARVLSDIDMIHAKESKIVLAAAVIDDVLGLIILGVVSAVVLSFEAGTGDRHVSFGVVSLITIKAFAFLAAAIVLGKFLAPKIFDFLGRLHKKDDFVWIQGIAFCFLYAYLSHIFGLAPIIGAFAAGLVLRETRQFQEIERGVKPVSHFFTPVFFVMIGAAVDVSVFNPFVSENLLIISIALILFVAAIVGKFASGYAVYEKEVKKSIIGVGMIPRGEVGLIFANMGLAYGVFKTDLFSAVTMMVILTTFIVPPLLKRMFENYKLGSTAALEGGPP